MYPHERVRHGGWRQAGSVILQANMEAGEGELEEGGNVSELGGGRKASTNGSGWERRNTSKHSISSARANFIHLNHHI